MKDPKHTAVAGAKYTHFKGGIYTVTAIATHSETLESLVIYSAPNGMVFARPRDMFEDGRFTRTD